MSDMMGDGARVARRRPIAVDLFCGGGGLSLGFEQAGFDVAVAIDNDPVHVRTHERNFPQCRTLLADVTQLTGRQIRELTALDDSPVDIVIGGPPCQGFSTIGKRSTHDARNLLVSEFGRLVSELGPMYWVMENVQGLMMGHSKILASAFVSTMKAAGYLVVEPVSILDAYDFGVPQHRRRVFMLGYRTGASRPAYPLALSMTNGSGQSRLPSVWDAIGDLAALDEDPTLITSDTYEGKLGSPSWYADMLRCSPRDVEYPYESDCRQGCGCRGLTGCRRSLHTVDVVRRFSDTNPGNYELVSRFYRLTMGGVSNTLRAGTGRSHGGYTAPRPIHPLIPRCITVREAARLQSFPDWFQFDRTIWHGFRQVGNSVPPLLARAVATQIKTCLDESSCALGFGPRDGGDG